MTGRRTSTAQRRLRDKAHRCHYCRVDLDYTNATIDHIVPASLGGTNALVNTVASCYPCNQEKSDRDVCACAGCDRARDYYLRRRLLDDAFDSLTIADFRRTGS